MRFLLSNQWEYIKLVTTLLILLSLVSCTMGRQQYSQVNSKFATEDQIRLEISQMADDFLSYREMQGFYHEMSLQEAYRWQDTFVEIMKPAPGDVIGYKAGGHDSGPGFAIFPKEGIRGVIVAGMVKPSGTTVREEDFRRGFLEADFAFRVGKRSINSARTDLEILAGLDAIIPFAEIPDPYYVPDSRTTNGTIAANMASRMSFTGEPIPLKANTAWLDKINTFTFAVFDENNIEIETGTIEGWYKPIGVVRWLRDQLKRSGKELVPGQLLSVGNIGIIRQLHEGSSRGPAYQSNQFRLEYYGLKDDGSVKVIINIDRSQ